MTDANILKKVKMRKEWDELVSKIINEPTKGCEKVTLKQYFREIMIDIQTRC
jgi:hypothetical protein